MRNRKKSTKMYNGCFFSIFFPFWMKVKCMCPFKRHNAICYVKASFLGLFLIILLFWVWRAFLLAVHTHLQYFNSYLCTHALVGFCHLSFKQFWQCALWNSLNEADVRYHHVIANLTFQYYQLKLDDKKIRFIICSCVF